MTDSDRPKIFITHSWHDLEFSRNIYNDLRGHGFEVWLDDRAVQAGERFAGAIDRGLEWCDVYIPVLSYASLTSPWCREEIEAAIALSNEQGRNGRPRIIPLLIENCQDQIPALLRARLFVNFTKGYDVAFKELLVKGFGSPHAAGRADQQERLPSGRPNQATPRRYPPEAAEQVQCPKCGNFRIKTARHYIDRSTGKPSNVTDNPVLILVGTFLSSLIFALIGSSVLGADTELFVLLAVIAFIIGFALANNERRKMISGKSTRVITKYQFDCRKCGFRWETEN